MKSKNSIISFLRGYGMALYYATASPTYKKIDWELNRKLESTTNHFVLYLLNNERIEVAINRGICPVFNKTALLANFNYNTLFDIARNWMSVDSWNILVKKYPYLYNVIELEGEVRIDIDELATFIELSGGIDYEKTFGYIQNLSNVDPYKK